MSPALWCSPELRQQRAAGVPRLERQVMTLPLTGGHQKVRLSSPAAGRAGGGSSLCSARFSHLR